MKGANSQLPEHLSADGCISVTLSSTCSQVSHHASQTHTAKTEGGVGQIFHKATVTKLGMEKNEKILGSRRLVLKSLAAVGQPTSR
jgi:hypothetical protein